MLLGGHSDARPCQSVFREILWAAATRDLALIQFAAASCFNSFRIPLTRPTAESCPGAAQFGKVL